MTSWNYRMRLDRGHVSVVEVYYDDDGRIEGWCPSVPGGDTVEELVDDLAAMVVATGTPVLTTAELPDE